MKRRIFVALSLGGVVVASFVVLTRDGPATEALASLPLANHGAALLATLVEVLLRGVRLLVLSSVMGLRITLPTATLTQLAADGGGAVTPLRSGADPGKALVLHRRGHARRAYRSADPGRGARRGHDGASCGGRGWR